MININIKKLIIHLYRSRIGHSTTPLKWWNISQMVEKGETWKEMLNRQHFICISFQNTLDLFCFFRSFFFLDLLEYCVVNYIFEVSMHSLWW